MLQRSSLPWTSPPPQHNLFFAIHPDAAAAERISRLAQEKRREHGLRSEPLAMDRFHISLLRLGAYAGRPHEIVEVARTVAAAIAVEPFTVEFDRVVSFRGGMGSRPLVLLASAGVASLAALRQVLGSAMVKGRRRPRAPSRFTPHITLTYDCRAIGEQAVDAIGWTVREFALVDSLIGQSRHVRVGRWALPG